MISWRRCISAARNLLRFIYVSKVIGDSFCVWLCQNEHGKRGPLVYDMGFGTFASSMTMDDRIFAVWRFVAI